MEGETHEDREGLIIQLANLRNRYAEAVWEANVLRREVVAWRSWRANGHSSSWPSVVRARKETDESGAFRAFPDDWEPDYRRNRPRPPSS